MSETPEFFETVLDENGVPTARVDMNKAGIDGVLLAGHAIEVRQDMQAVFSLMNKSAADQGPAGNVVAAYMAVRLTFVVDTLARALAGHGVPESQIKEMLYEK